MNPKRRKDVETKICKLEKIRKKNKKKLLL